MKRNKDDLKKRIILLLTEKKDWLSTTKLASEICSNPFLTTKYLDELLSDKKIERFKISGLTYWKIKGGKK